MRVGRLREKGCLLREALQEDELDIEKSTRYSI